MSEDKDTDTNFELSQVGAELTRDDKEETTEQTVSEEKLRKAQLIDEINAEVSTVRELPKREKPKAQIPESGELGKKFTIKLGKRYDVVNLKVYQGEKIEENAGNTNIIHDKEEKRKDEISYDFFDPLPLKGKTLNGLVAGKYLIVVHAYGKEAGDELEQEKVVSVN